MTNRELKKYANKTIYALYSNSLKKFKVTVHGNFALVNEVMPDVKNIAQMEFIKKYYPRYMTVKPHPDLVSELELKILVS